MELNNINNSTKKLKERLQSKMNQTEKKKRILGSTEDRISGMEDKVEGLYQISKEFEKKFKRKKEMLEHTGNVGHHGKC